MEIIMAACQNRSVLDTRDGRPSRVTTDAPPTVVVVFDLSSQVPGADSPRGLGLPLAEPHQ